jgi:hypothetical protein
MSKESELNDAIAEAQSIMDEIDGFDLHSDNPEEVKQFEKLVKDHDAAVAEVIKIAKGL